MALEDVAFGVPEHCTVGLARQKTHKLNEEGSLVSKPR